MKTRQTEYPARNLLLACGALTDRRCQLHHQPHAGKSDAPQFTKEVIDIRRLLLRPAEAAQLLGIGRSKMYELLAAGELPSVKLGRSIRVPVKALETWIDEQLAEGGNAYATSHQ